MDENLENTMEIEFHHGLTLTLSAAIFSDQSQWVVPGACCICPQEKNLCKGLLDSVTSFLQ